MQTTEVKSGAAMLAPILKYGFIAFFVALLGGILTRRQWYEEMSPRLDRLYKERRERFILILLTGLIVLGIILLYQ
jgi:hypothetical protein